MSANHYMFVAVKALVMRGTEVIARAKSSSVAKRIAFALNYYAQRNQGRLD